METTHAITEYNLTADEERALAQVPRVGREGAAGLVLTVLAASFGNADLPATSALTADQRRVLRADVDAFDQ